MASTPPVARWLSLVTLLVTLLLVVALVAYERPVPPEVCPDPDRQFEPQSDSQQDASARIAVRVWPRSEQERAELAALAHDVWSEHAGTELDLVLDPAGVTALRSRGIEFTELVSDVLGVAEQERERLRGVEAARPPPPGEWFSEYRDLETIHAYLEQLARLRPELVELRTIGYSLEGRPLQVLRIHGNGSRNGNGVARGTDSVTIGAPGERPRRMFVDGGLHAREWISMMVTTCVADRLIRGYDDDPALRRFVDEVELWVLPVANPDGYVHSWRRDRYWRKNRRAGHGVDLNRNFGLAWGGDGSSGKPASSIYRGTAPFSEPESAAIRSLMEAERFDVHIDFHSYGQLVLHPWSHTRKRSSDHQRLRQAAEGIVTAIASEHGERYRLISGASLYPASGTLMDWAYGTQGVASFVIELRPRGGTGFVLPPDQIVPTCDEGLAAVMSVHPASALPHG